MAKKIEDAIMSQWKNILGLDEISIQDNFFEIGGDSITVLQLVAALKSEFQMPVNASAILKHPTVMKLAEYVFQKSELNSIDSDSCIVCLQNGDQEQYLPLILIHAADGDVYIYSHLTNGMPEKFPIYAIRSPVLDGKIKFDSLEKMAQYYLDEIYKAGIKPPFFIGGSSLGGVVGFHIAQIMSKQGNFKPTVISIDAPAYTNLPDAFDKDILILEYLNKYMFSQLGIHDSELRVLSSTQEQTDFIIQRAKETPGMKDILPENFGPGFISTWREQQRIMNYYIAEPYEGDMVFFSHTEHTPEFPPDQHLDWEKIVNGNFIHYKVPGNHSSMNSHPNVDTIVKHLVKIMQSSPRTGFSIKKTA